MSVTMLEIAPDLILNSLPAEELQDAANETSDRYEALVLAAAVRIVQRRLRLTGTALAERMNVCTKTVCSWRNAAPFRSHKALERQWALLAMTLEDA